MYFLSYSQVKNSPYFSYYSANVYTKGYKSYSEFKKIWNRPPKNIDYLYIYAHGGTGTLNFGKSILGLNGTNSFSELKTVVINKKVYLFSCKGGSPLDNKNSVANILSLKTNQTVRACTIGVSFHPLRINTKLQYAHSQRYMSGKFMDFLCKWDTKRKMYSMTHSLTPSKTGEYIVQNVSLGKRRFEKGVFA